MCHVCLKSAIWVKSEVTYDFEKLIRDNPATAKVGIGDVSTWSSSYSTCNGVEVRSTVSSRMRELIVCAVVQIDDEDTDRHSRPVKAPCSYIFLLEQKKHD